MTKDRTKEAVALELERMMTEMPLSKVRVGELCARSGIGRQTFYYHFRDKFDVVAWIFEHDYRLAEAATLGGDPIAVVTDALERMWERRAFYRAAFTDKSQNSIAEAIQDFDVRLMSQLICDYYGVDAPTDWQMFAIKHHSHGSIGCTVEWFNGDIVATPEQLANWEFARMPDFMRKPYGL